MTTARQFQQAAKQPKAAQGNTMPPMSPPARSKDENGDTALIRFARNGDVWMVTALAAKKNIDLNARNNRGLNAAMEAMRNGHIDVVDALLKAGANVNIQSNENFTLLHYAISWGPDAVNLVLKEKPDLALVDSDGNTALHKTALLVTAEMEIVAALIEAGVDAYLPDRHGRTAADCARGRNDEACAQQIEKLAWEKDLREIKTGTTRPLRLRQIGKFTP